MVKSQFQSSCMSYIMIVIVIHLYPHLFILKVHSFTMKKLWRSWLVMVKYVGQKSHSWLNIDWRYLPYFFGQKKSGLKFREYPQKSHVVYTLVNAYISMERSTILNGKTKTHYSYGHGFHSKLSTFLPRGKWSSFPAGHQLMAGFFAAFINSPSMVLFPEPLAPTLARWERTVALKRTNWRILGKSLENTNITMGNHHFSMGKSTISMENHHF